MSVAKIVILWLLYFIILSIGFSAMVFGGLIEQERMETNIVYAGSDYSVNNTITSDEITVTNTLETLLAFATFDVNLGLPVFAEWVISIIFIWFPGLILVILTYYSFKSGGA